MNDAVRKILKETAVEVSSDTFSLVSIAKEAWPKLLEDQALSPRGTSPFMIFSDKHEVTLLLDGIDFGTIRQAIRDAKIERGFRMLTFDTVMDFTVVGFLAEVIRILAEAGISIVALSAFSRDHLLVKQSDLANVLKALRPLLAPLLTKEGWTPLRRTGWFSLGSPPFRGGLARPAATGWFSIF